MEPTRLPASRRGMRRGSRPRKHLRHGDTEVTYSSAQHVPTKAYARKPCKLTSWQENGTKRWGVFYGNREKPQKFKTKEAAERFQLECWRTFGFKGLGKMAKAKKSKKKPAKKSSKSVAARKARGAHCVYTPSGKLFNCFAEKGSAENVVNGMNKGYRKTCKVKRIAPGEGWTLKSSGASKRR